MPVEKVPPRAPDQVRRLTTTLTSLPALAGRLVLDDPPPAPPNYSGALLVRGTWTDPDGPRPAIAKIGANVSEARWATLLARETADLVPEVYASGAALGGEELPWLVMERAPLLLDHSWGAALYDTLLDAGARFQLATRRLEPVGPADVGEEQISAFAREDGEVDPALPSAAVRLLRQRFSVDWAWALSACTVEMCHGDLHPANAVWRVAPPDRAARALLIDHAPRPLPWAFEPAYCQVLYWTAGCRADGPGLVHRMAAIRASYGLQVPAAPVVDRLAALFLAWHSLRLWPYLTARRTDPRWLADVRYWIETAGAG